MSRPSCDEVAMENAVSWSRRSTCLRRKVGCVLTNGRGHVLATGFNGVAAGLPHCNHAEMVGADYVQLGSDPAVQTPSRLVVTHPHACPGATAPSGTNLDGCGAIHAEQNALLQCRDVYSIHTCYTTASPCMTCLKLLLNTSCERIVFIDEYSHTAAKDLWLSAGRQWEKMSFPQN